MGYKSVRHICEQVISAQLAAEPGLAGVNVYTGDSAALQEDPRVVVLAESARPPADLPEGLGNYSVSMRMTLVSSADDTTLSQHRARCAALAGSMQDLVALKAGFVATGDALLYDVTETGEDDGYDERTWATMFTYEVLCVVNPQ